MFIQDEVKNTTVTLKYRLYNDGQREAALFNFPDSELTLAVRDIEQADIETVTRIRIRREKGR